MSKSTLRRLVIQHKDDTENLGRFLAAWVTKDALEIALKLLEEREEESRQATWENLGLSFIDYPEPDQTYGAADG